MTNLRSRLTLYQAVLFFVLQTVVSANIVVTSIQNGIINTVERDVKLRGISFQKMAINQTSEASVIFNISSVTVADEYEFAWELNGESITNFVTRYPADVPANPTELFTTEVLSDNNLVVTLHLRRRRLVPGKYKLTVSHNEHTGFAIAEVHAPPMVPEFSKIKTHLPGDRLSISCQVTGYPLPEYVNWSFAPVKRELMRDFSALNDAQSNLQPLEDDGEKPFHFVSNTVANDQLVFEDLPENYGGLYQCLVTLSGHEDRSLILVHIKDRYAAIWPFIGIVIEVTVLVIGILLYERHQMRSRSASAKAEAPAAPQDVSPKPGPDAQVTTPTAAPQQNNISAVGEIQGENSPQGDGRPNGPEAGDDVRLRTVARC